FFFSSRRRHTSFSRDWSSDVCASDLPLAGPLWEAKAEKAWEGALAGACGGLGTRARRGREAFGPAPFGDWDAAPPKMRCRYPRCAPPELLIPEPASGRLFFHSKVRSTTRCTDSPVFF